MGRSRINVSHSQKCFNDSFEEQILLSYAYNLIHSNYLKTKTASVYEFANYILSGKVSALLRKYLSECDIEEDFEVNVPEKVLILILRNDISVMISSRLQKLSGEKQTPLTKRLGMIQSAFDLSNEEISLLLFFYLIEADSTLSAFFVCSHGIDDFSMKNIFYNRGHSLIGLQRREFLKALKNGSLFKSLLLENNMRSIQISDWCFDCLSGFGNCDISHKFYSKPEKTVLKTADFNIPDENLQVFHNILSREGGKNILIYGVPGSGKTSFTKAFAAEHRKSLLIVGSPESDEHKIRLGWIYATLNLADKNDSIVLIDEADEVLNSWESHFLASRTNKSWINTVLDSHNKKVIWIVNRIEEIDSSTLRRFDFSIEFKGFTASQRAALLRSELKRRGMKNYLNEEDILDICNRYSVNADGIVNALDEVTAAKNKSKKTVLKQVRLILENREKLIGLHNAETIKMRNSNIYSLEGLNCTEDPQKIVNIVKKYSESSERLANANRYALSLLLYGLPGTGKTEFVLYLGQHLNKEVILRRSSDIQSKYVGETEKNIANAFSEAKTKGSILFFDEADTFLFPRKDADKSWEKSFTNEILAQMDAHSGILVFATNDIDGLDHAALRRFKFKIEFKPLSPEGIIHFYERMLSSLLPRKKKLSIMQVNMLKQLTNLTPGDFAVVRDKMLFEESKNINHDMLIKALINETKYKKNSGNRVIGFVSA